jgi:phenylacetate-CoA ligase
VNPVDRIYANLPRMLQNAAISIQGGIFRYKRFGGDFSRRLATAIAVAEAPRHVLEDRQIEQLREFVSHAAVNSPYYRNSFAKAGVVPEDILALDSLSGFPVLEKADLRERTEEIRAENIPKKTLSMVHTSGTSGTPITVGYTADDRRQRFAYLYRMFHHHGIPPFARSVRFSGRALFPKAERTNIVWRMNWSMNQMLMSSYHLHPDRMHHYANRLHQFQPDLIDGYPSSIFVLARYLNETDQAGWIQPKLVMTTAETLEDYQREEIMRAFGGCRVINQYASSEGAPFITEDEYGDLVVNIDTGVFEFVRPGTTEPANNGELAEMLVTSFTTHAYPLIRYRIGDTVLLPKEPRLAQSWQMPVVERIMGRQEDILFTPFRGYSGSLNKVFADAPSSIVESQIVQVAPTEIVFRVVPDKTRSFKYSDLDLSVAELRARLGEVTVRIELHDSLPRGKNGKLRAVVGLTGPR